MCENCRLRKENPALYNLRMQWVGHAQLEEFYQKQNNGEMQSYHKNQRLKLEQELRR